MCFIVIIMVFILKGVIDLFLNYYLEIVWKNGVIKIEMVELLIYFLFYVGWLNVWVVFWLVKEVYVEDYNKEEYGGLFG